MQLVVGDAGEEGVLTVRYGEGGGGGGDGGEGDGG